MDRHSCAAYCKRGWGSQPKILVATDRLYGRTLFILDGKTHAVEHQYLFDSGAPLYSLDVLTWTETENRKSLPVRPRSYGAPHLYLCDRSRDCTVIWKSANLTTYWGAVYNTLVTDVGAPGIDIVAVSVPVHRIRWSDKQDLATTGTNYLSVTAADVLGQVSYRSLQGAQTACSKC